MRIGSADTAFVVRRQRRGIFPAVLVACCLLSVGPALGHGDPNQRIIVLGQRISAEPANASLYVARGRLYRVDGHYSEALRDFERAARLNPALNETEYLRGVTLLQMARPTAGKSMLDRYIHRYPDAPLALAARARARVMLRDYPGAAADFTRAIVRSPIPDYYLERARALAAAGAEHLDDAVRGLDEGLARLGMLTALQRLAIDLEVARTNIDGAVRRVERMAKLTKRPDIWITRKGDILAAAGRDDHAREAYRTALNSIAKLHPRHRASKQVHTLKLRLHALLSDGAAGRAGVDSKITSNQPEPK